MIFSRFRYCDDDGDDLLHARNSLFALTLHGVKLLHLLEGREQVNPLLLLVDDQRRRVKSQVGRIYMNSVENLLRRYNSNTELIVPRT
jgi:hypothetical protein